MSKTTVKFLYKVRGDYSPVGLQKVYFSCTNEDKKLIHTIAEDIWNIVDCAVYYHEEIAPNFDVDMSDFEQKLSEMKLFVVLITTKYLTTKNIAKEFEFGYAVKHHIPIIPIAMESGLEVLFSNKMNEVCPGYGDIQLLKYQVTDRSELPYQDKLTRDIKSILFDTEDVNRIKNAFTSEIFLSYRKKDRVYAQQLMNIIHTIPSLQRTAIWYDEYLSTGEVWSNQIKDALENSDLFLLLVTPSIVEPDNYVIREEFPAAKRKKKTIVPVQKDSQNFTAETEEKLREYFPELQTLIDGDDAGALEQALAEVSNLNSSTLETDYLIGLAFFNGIHVEKNTEKAISLIIATAKKGLPEAINKVADMYWNGDGLERNYEQSIHYRKEIVSVYESKCSGKECRLDDMLEYISSLERLTKDLYELGIYREAYCYGIKLLNATKLLVQLDVADESKQSYASACDIAGKVCIRLGMTKQAREYYQQYCNLYQKYYEDKPTINNYHNLSIGYERLGDVEYETANFEAALSYFDRVHTIRSELNIKLDNPDSAYSLSCVCIAMGDAYIRVGRISDADKMYDEAFELRKRMADANPSTINMTNYGDVLIEKSTIALLLRKFDQAEGLLTDAEEIFRVLAEETGIMESWRRYAITLNRKGNLWFRKHDGENAVVCYQKSLDIRKDILKKYRSNEAVFDCALTLYYLAQCYELLLKKVEQMAALEEVIALLSPILALDRKTDWHRIYAEAAFDRFKIDTFSGNVYLQYAIQGWEWLCENNPTVDEYRKNLEMCRKIYKRCYSGK